MIQKERIILGIDPGTSLMGYGLIRCQGKKTEMLTMGEVNLQKIKDPYLTLSKIFDRTIQLIDHYNPDELAIEAPFFGKNVQSMLKLGRAQGVAIAAALSREIPIFEYAPRKIKQSITGKGTAEKEQVAYMLQQIYKFPEIPNNLDATDGLAVALCHFFQGEDPIPYGKGGEKSWKTFISKNPGRIK